MVRGKFANGPKISYRQTCDWHFLRMGKIYKWFQAFYCVRFVCLLTGELGIAAELCSRCRCLSVLGVCHYNTVNRACNLQYSCSVCLWVTVVKPPRATIRRKNIVAPLPRYSTLSVTHCTSLLACCLVSLIGCCLVSLDWLAGRCCLVSLIGWLMVCQ